MMLLKIVGMWYGEHKWEDVPDRYAFLGKCHQHDFHFEANIVVTEDREVEFLELAAHCREHMQRYLYMNVGSSCETLARVLQEQLTAQGFICTRTEVTEDGMCGAIYIPMGVDTCCVG